MKIKDKVVVVTGAASGIMEAGHRGAGREHSMGLNIMLPFEQGPNATIADDPKLVTKAKKGGAKAVWHSKRPLS